VTGAGGAGGAGRGAEGVTLSIDGKEVTVPKGTLIIRAAEQLGVEIPRFCDHPYLDPAGSCRQCYVEVEGQRKLMTSCTTPVVPGMVVKTQNTSEQAQHAQVANLEFLLLNHPLDCPICDRGGECPLQDQALAFGPGESRYREAKRTYEKPLHLSALVALDRERCVLCARCTRFCDQVSGDRFIELFDRGAAEQVAIAPGEDFRSPFSGNTIQICPVGALTAIPYRFAARPFDLKTADSVCMHCSAGCNLRTDQRGGTIVRHLARDNPDVNDLWTCDKGRFAFRVSDSEHRLATPMLRVPGLEPVSFGEAFAAIRDWSAGGRVAFLCGGRLLDEDAFALSRLARTVFRTNDLDHRRYPSGAVPEAVEAAAASVTYRDVERARAIVVVGLDAEQEVPILHLRIRKAARRGAKVFVIHPRRTRLWDVAEHLLCPPGQERRLLRDAAGAASFGDDRPSPVEAPAMEHLRAALREDGEDVVVLAGTRLAGSPGAVAEAAALAASVGGRFAFVPRRAGDRGALRAGVHPSLLPGGRRVSDAGERGEVEAVWGALPGEPGRDGAAILEACARREVDVLYLVGVDPLRDFPNAALARSALENVRFKVVQDILAGPFAPYADALLPATGPHERDGHVTDWEGRSQRVRPVRGPLGMARPDWQIFQELSVALGADMGFGSIVDVQEEMARLDSFGGVGPGQDSGERFPRSADASLGPDVPLRPPPRSSVPPDLAEGQVLLFTYPLLVDDGVMSEASPELKAALQDEPFVEIHPSDAARLGLGDGAVATVTTEAGVASVPVRVTDGVAEGAVFVPFNQPGLAANTLLSGGFVVAATVEAAS
jgi:NADH-quinone oxidoreductase subunit G